MRKKLKKKKRLGQFLLKGFVKKPNHREKSRSRNLQIKRTASNRLRMRSLPRVDGESPSVFRRKFRTPLPPQASPPESQPESQIETRIDTQPQASDLSPQQPLVTPVSPGTPDPAPSGEVAVPAALPTQPTPVVIPEVQPAQLILPSADATFLSTSDILKPHDKLKQSIEAFLLDQRSVHTRKAYGKDLKRFVQFLHGRNLRQGPDTLTRAVLIAYKESLLADGLQHTSIDRHLATLRSFFRWLVDDGIIEKSPAEGVRFLNPKKLSTTLGFSDEEVQKILTIPDLHRRTGAQHYAILMVLFYCGLRRSELCSLKTSNLGTERNHRVIRLRGKGNAERVIVLTDPVWNALKHYFYITRRDIEKDTADVYLFSPIRNNRTGILDKPLDPSMIFYIVTRYAKRAGIMNRVSPHSCRATAISNARDHHVPDRAIQEFAGWASPDMITRYDKRRTSVEESASHAIRYGAENRSLPKSQLDQESQKEPPKEKAKGESPTRDSQLEKLAELLLEN